MTATSWDARISRQHHPHTGRDGRATAWRCRAASREAWSPWVHAAVCLITVLDGRRGQLRRPPYTATPGFLPLRTPFAFPFDKADSVSHYLRLPRTAAFAILPVTCSGDDLPGSCGSRDRFAVDHHRRRLSFPARVAHRTIGIVRR